MCSPNVMLYLLISPKELSSDFTAIYIAKALRPLRAFRDRNKNTIANSLRTGNIPKGERHG